MKVTFQVTSPEGEVFSGSIGKLSKRMGDRAIRWLVYGFIIDRSRPKPLGLDPNDCLVEIERLP